MSKDISGTPGPLILDGIPFDVAAEADINEMGSAFETTARATSGRNAFAKVRRVESREDVGLEINGEERVILREIADRTEVFPMSYTDAAGDTYTATGLIEFVNRQTATNLAVVNLFPVGSWEPFLAS